MNYRVIVGNVGEVCYTSSEEAARTTYAEYVELSRTGYGRAAGEAVTLLEDSPPLTGHPIEEHHGYQHMYENYPGWQLQDLVSRRREADPTLCPVCGGSTPMDGTRVKVVLLDDDDKDVRYHINRKCKECGFRFKDVLRTVGAELNEAEE